MIQTGPAPINLLRYARKITGMSAILLPFTDQGAVDWDGFCAHVARTAEVGLIPAVDMDTGYVNLLDDETRLIVLARTRETLGEGAFVAGAFVGDQPAAPWDLDAYRRQISAITHYGGTPVIFQSYGLTSQNSDAIIASYAQLGRECDRFIAFELGRMFAPFGKIYDLEVFRRLLAIPQCIGAKHSSLSRELEWERLQL